ncbi:Cell number regulator 10 [Cyphellophora attinorum]|uniref:Cell number regulator 10 n=1 Tax=Cyphellophora attinorum TaxID=1664694 RepID=A0A0N0NMR6_9EURO|nr:Cell number regulator 10 [Phialophora attinorum]KPI40519.1 Cell number regulator 10 [Phialophora attinorum]
MSSQAPSDYAVKPEHQQAHAYPPQAGHSLPAKFQFGLFDCFSPIGTCCLATWCPCVVYGRIKEREEGVRDPSGMNGQCALHGVLLCCGVSWILQFVNRMSMREKHGMESNGFGDCCTAFCCPCCELIQEDKEMVVRHTGMDPKTKQAYVPPPSMSYP